MIFYFMFIFFCLFGLMSCVFNGFEMIVDFFEFLMVDFLLNENGGFYSYVE